MKNVLFRKSDHLVVAGRNAHACNADNAREDSCYRESSTARYVKIISRPFACADCQNRMRIAGVQVIY